MTFSQGRYGRFACSTWQNHKRSHNLQGHLIIQVKTRVALALKEELVGIYSQKRLRVSRWIIYVINKKRKRSHLDMPSLILWAALNIKSGNSQMAKNRWINSKSNKMNFRMLPPREMKKMVKILPSFPITLMRTLTLMKPTSFGEFRARWTIAKI